MHQGVVIILAALCAFFQHAITVASASGQDYTQQRGWGGSCVNGKQQSPIDIKRSRFNSEKKMEGLNFKNLDLKLSVLVTNDAPSVKFTISGKKRPTISGGKLTGSYVLDSFHPHWPSEHTIDGQYFDLEVHFVFYSSQYSNLTEASGDSNGLAVVGVFYNVGRNKGPIALDILATATSQVSGTPGGQALIKSIDLSDLIPHDNDAYFTYKGSLTTPTCGEIVNWHVFKDPLSISKSKYEKLTTVYGLNGNIVEFNNRDLQPLNGRLVEYQEDD